MPNIYTDIENAIRQYFDANWTATTKTYEGVKFDPNGQPFVYLRVQPLETTQTGIGSGSTGRKYRTVGLIYLHIYVPANKGTMLANQYADQLSGLFRGKSIEHLTCRDVVPEYSGKADEAGQYLVRSLSIDFWADVVD